MQFGSNPYSRRSGIPGGSMMLFLIILNAALFLLVPYGSEAMMYLAMLSGVETLAEPWRFLTAVFLHGSFSHVFFNMFGLFIFGQLIADRMGGRKLLWLFLVSGIAGNLLWYIIAMAGGQAGVLVGASGAVMGVIAASAMLMPNIEMLILFIPFPVKLKVLAIVYFALDVAGEVLSSSPVAFTAHIGGFLAGVFFIRIFAKDLIEWDPVSALFGKKKKVTVIPFPEDKGKLSRNNEIVRILEKLSRSGINSLTDEELRILRQEHDKMTKDNGR